MTLLTPAALALAAVAIPIILLYVLKLRRREQVVSSTLLWRRSLDDVQANAPWQKLRPNLLLLLQLLILLALVLALAGPAYSRSHAVEGDLVLIVDQSYGMQARDIKPSDTGASLTPAGRPASRFEAALARAHSLVHELASGNVASVIGMGAEPQLRVAESGDQGALDRAIDGLRAGVAPPNFLAALSLAASLARSGEKTRVVVLTSRDSGIAGLPLTISFPVDIVRFGGRLRDLGITAFQVTSGGGKLAALARVSNFGDRTVASDLDLYVDGRLTDVRPLSVGAGREQSIFWSGGGPEGTPTQGLLPSGAQRFEVRLTVHDDFTADKSAWAVAAAPQPVRVLLVTRGNYFLQTALGLRAGTQLSTVQPAGYSPTVARGFDLVVFDGFLPAQLPAVPVMITAPTGTVIGSLRFGPAVSLAGRSLVAAASATPDSTAAQLLQYVDLSDVHIAVARTLAAPAWLQPVVTAAGLPVLAAGDDGTRRLVVFAFDLQQSDWPLRVSFPVLVQNVARYLAPGLTLGATSVVAGQAISFAPPPGTSAIVITRPDGSQVTLRPRSGSGGPAFAPYADTGQPGIYTARAAGRLSTAPVSFAVNFFPARAASSSGPSVLHLGGASSGTSGSHVVGVPVSVAWVFGLLTLAVLLVEWWIAFRR